MHHFMLLRHAKSDWSDGSLTDFQRPLNPRGKRAAASMARWMQKEHRIPDRILCSSAQRAMETLQRLQKAWHEEEASPSPAIDVHFLETLYLAPPQTILEAARAHAPGSRNLMVIGHNPGMEMLASQLSHRHCTMPTAALAIFQSKGGWPEDWLESASWSMQDLVVPDKEK